MVMLFKPSISGDDDETRGLCVFARGDDRLFFAPGQAVQ
jgi:hypothetical protein